MTRIMDTTGPQHGAHFGQDQTASVAATVSPAGAFVRCLQRNAPAARAALALAATRAGAAILLATLVLIAPASAHSQPLDAQVVEEERLRTCARVFEWTERFHCIYEFTVLARRVREFPNYSGVELKDDVRHDIELTFEKLKRQFAVRG